MNVIYTWQEAYKGYIFGFFLRIFGTDKGYRKLRAMKSSEDDTMSEKM